MRSDRIVKDRPGAVKSNCFLDPGVKRSRVRHAPSSHHGRPMRSRALLLIPALAVVPSIMQAQRIIERDCRERYTPNGTRYYSSCPYDAEIAARAREAAARARADAQWAREDARRYAAEIRANARSWDRDFDRARIRAIDTRIRNEQRAAEQGERARERAAEARERSRERAIESRERARERAERDRDRARDRAEAARERALRNRYYNRW